MGWTDLSLRHHVEVVAVQGEGHVSEDGAAVLDDRHGLILHPTMRGAVHADLREHTHTQWSEPELLGRSAILVEP